MSVGLDARIGFGFDKNRTQNRILNKLQYGIEGMKKLFLKTEKINTLIKELRIV